MTESEDVRPGVRDGAVRIVEETNKPIARVTRDLGVNEGTLGTWVNRALGRPRASGVCARTTARELKQLRDEVAELRMERDVHKRSVVMWVKEATSERSFIADQRAM